MAAARGAFFLKLGCGAVLGALVIGVLTFILFGEATCGSGSPGSDGNPYDAAPMCGLGALIAGALGFAGGLIVISVVILGVRLWRTRPGEPEWP
jgi:hypothetical protein